MSQLNLTDTFGVDLLSSLQIGFDEEGVQLVKLGAEVSPAASGPPEIFVAQ